MSFAQSDVKAPTYRDVFAFRSFLPDGQAAGTVKRKKPGPRMEGSFTGGYIEDAIVRDQIRFRFDAAFSFDAPDRGEFFYAKCGCYRGLPATNAALDKNAPGPGPGIAVRLNSQELHLNLEYAPIQRLSFFADVPERSVEFTSVVGGTLNNASGFGDFEAGLKFALVASEQTYVTFELGAFMPTGDAARGLGTNHYTVQPMLLLNHRWGERVNLIGQFGDFHPIGGSAGFPTVSSPNGFSSDILEYGFGGGYRLTPTPGIHITPLIEFVGWHVFDGFVTSATNAVAMLNPEVSAAGTNIVNVKVGARFTFQTHHSLYAGYGQALTNAHWYHEILRIEYRYMF